MAIRTYILFGMLASISVSHLTHSSADIAREMTRERAFAYSSERALANMSTQELSRILQSYNPETDMCGIYRPEDVAREAFSRLGSGDVSPDELGPAYQEWAQFISRYERSLTALYTYRELKRDVKFWYGYEGSLDDIFALIERGYTAYDAIG
jgi:hypothetical protein